MFADCMNQSSLTPLYGAPEFWVPLPDAAPVCLGGRIVVGAVGGGVACPTALARSNGRGARNGHQSPGAAQPDIPKKRMARAAKVSRCISVTPNGHRQKLAELIAIIGMASNAG